jgi:hypothetical protein
MEAARIALERHCKPVPDNAVLTVIIDGLGLMLSGCTEHNRMQPTYWHRAGAVRRF